MNYYDQIIQTRNRITQIKEEIAQDIKNFEKRSKTLNNLNNACESLDLAIQSEMRFG